MGNVVVGTCSWAEKTMVERWYPDGAKTPEARLRYYASRFDAVEVDSPFYGIPRTQYAEAWAKRTPPGFTFHVKAYGMLTGHDVDEHALHPDLRDSGYDYELTTRGWVRRPEPRMVERASELFVTSIQPLADAGKLGGILMQYPPWFTAENREKREANLARIARDAELLSPHPVFVEFRHASWAAPGNLERTMRFLADRQLAFVAVDAPAVETGAAMPPVSAATAPWGYVRFHGRNKDTWHARTASAADRFDYEYTSGELAEWREPIARMAEETERTWVMFNNCKYDYAPNNAREMASILGDLVAPRAGGVATGEPAPDAAEQPGGIVGEAEDDGDGAGRADPGSMTLF